MKYLYHYHAMWQSVCGGIAHADGTAERSHPVDTPEQYTIFKKGVANECGIAPEKLTVCSLTLLCPHNAQILPR
jgi:hypothetical protein